ncbi:MAG: hypothetical protein SOZ56_07960, partial [Oscillospiraceae bacterium]|nr:hypothetical protein [Oscillospiraceae bacterium]
SRSFQIKSVIRKKTKFFSADCFVTVRFFIKNAEYALENLFRLPIDILVHMCYNIKNEIPLTVERYSAAGFFAS